jgi:DNA-binding FadR family transcriptional regulator
MAVRPKARKLHEQLAEELARDIVSGRLASGDTIPSEPELVAKYEVSKTVVRETVQLLASAGMLNVQHGKRTRVNPLADWNILNPLVHVAYRDEQRAGLLMEELYEVRLMLEPHAARLTAERANGEQIEALDALLEQMSEAIDSGDERAFLDHDHDFHTLIIGTGAANRVLQAILRDIHALLNASWVLTSLSKREMRTVLALHEDIARAISDRDGAAAEAAMRKHLTWAMAADRASGWGAEGSSDSSRGGRR